MRKCCGRPPVGPESRRPDGATLRDIRALTTTVLDRPLASRSATATLVVFAALVCAYVGVSDNTRLLKFIVLLIALAVGFALPPQSFIAASVLAFGISTSFHKEVMPSSPVPIYFSDFTALLVVARGALPAARLPARRVLAGAPIVAFAAWALVMVFAAFHGMHTGTPLTSALRGDLALGYWPALYFGYSRILRERRLDTGALWRQLAIVIIGLAAWMFVARALNIPFNDPGLAAVPTGVTTTINRNFGFAGAFVFFPLLALVGIAGMAHARATDQRWTLMAAIGSIATLTTLVRGEIFSLAIGALVILWFKPRRGDVSARGRSAVQIAFAIVAGILVLGVASPKLGNAIVQRAVPFTHQAPEAKANVQYRQKAVHTGFRVASDHPAGLGILDFKRLMDRNIDPNYFAHSGVATLLVSGGWFALVTAMLAILAVIRLSFQRPTPIPWLQPAFVAVMVMLTLYSIGAAGLAGDPWVIPLGVLAIVLRFSHRASQAPAAA